MPGVNQEGLLERSSLVDLAEVSALIWPVGGIVWAKGLVREVRREPKAQATTVTKRGCREKRGGLREVRGKVGERARRNGREKVFLATQQRPK